jgi:hypothetical protein
MPAGGCNTQMMVEPAAFSRNRRFVFNLRKHDGGKEDERNLLSHIFFFLVLKDGLLDLSGIVGLFLLNSGILRFA